MDRQQTFLEWMKSYRRDSNHALRDANRNLKGFKVAMREAMELYSVDYAFRVAVNNVLKANS